VVDQVCVVEDAVPRGRKEAGQVGEPCPVGVRPRPTGRRPP
jgi:hypothetical protein